MADETIRARLIKAQAEFSKISKDKQAKAFGNGAGYQYADINAVLEIVRPILNNHGIGLTQSVSTDATASIVTVTTEIFDAEGNQIKSGDFSVKTESVNQRGIQALGSAITYARRYSLMSFLGIAYGEKDDDGAEATAGEYSRTPVRSKTFEKEQRAPAPELPDEKDQAEVTASIISAIGSSETYDDLDDVASAMKNAKLSDKRLSFIRDAWKKKREEIKQA